MFAFGKLKNEGADVEVQKRHIRNCMQADPGYGDGVANALGIPPSDVLE